MSVKKIRQYDDNFKRKYVDWLKGFDNNNLVTTEQDLSDFIDSEFFDGFLLADEVLVLYELVRDECVRRVAKMNPCDTQLA